MNIVVLKDYSLLKISHLSEVIYKSKLEIGCNLKSWEQSPIQQHFFLTCDPIPLCILSFAMFAFLGISVSSSMCWSPGSITGHQS